MSEDEWQRGMSWSKTCQPVGSVYAVVPQYGLAGILWVLTGVGLLGMFSSIGLPENGPNAAWVGRLLGILIGGGAGLYFAFVRRALVATKEHQDCRDVAGVVVTPGNEVILLLSDWKTLHVQSTKGIVVKNAGKVASKSKITFTGVTSIGENVSRTLSKDNFTGSQYRALAESVGKSLANRGL
jgi:hypothetical protein